MLDNVKMIFILLRIPYDPQKPWFVVYTNRDKLEGAFETDDKVQRLFQSSELMYVDKYGEIHDDNNWNHETYALALVGNEEFTYVQSWGHGKEVGKLYDQIY